MAGFPGYAPNFKIEISGEPIPAAMRASIMRVSYQDGLQGADRVEMVLANEGLQWLDHELLDMDRPFTLSMGYAPDPPQEMFVGEITGVTPAFPNSGMPTITVVAHDFLQRMTVGTKERAFALNLPCIGKFPLPDPVIAELVSATNLLIPVVDPAGAALSFLTLLATYAINPLEAKNGIRIQKSQSDFDFLSTIAKENGWEMYIDHTMEPRGYVLRFQFLIQEYFPSVFLKWGESLADFTPKLSTVGQVIGVSTRIWISSIQLELVIVLSWDFDRESFDLMVYPGIGNLDEMMGTGKSEKVVHVESVGPASAPKNILSELLPRLNNRITSSGSTMGNTAIRAGKVMQVDGIPGQFGGLYRVTSATHTIDSGGYKTQFDARKEVWFRPLPLLRGPFGGLRVQGQTIR